MQWLSGSVLIQDQGAAGWSLTGVTVLCPLVRHINSTLVLVQHPYMTEKLLMGSKESNEANKNYDGMYSKRATLIKAEN